MTSLRIDSPANPRVKALVRLRDRKEREITGLILIEGAREASRAMQAIKDLSIFEVKSATCYYCSAQLSEDGQKLLDTLPAMVQRCELSTAAFGKAALREGTDGVLLTLPQTVFGQRGFEAISTNADKVPLLLAVEGVEKPGNLGAILRTADALNADAVVVLDPRCDLASPQVIRASIGAVFHVNCFATTSEDLRKYCLAKKLKIFGAALSTKSVAYTSADFSKGGVILCGSEADGLSTYWLNNADQLIQIPMLGIGDSLNVSVAAAVIAFEAVRQRPAIKKP